MRVAIITHQARPADAIGNIIADKVAFFVDRGADVRVFAEVVNPPHPRLDGRVTRFDTIDVDGEAFRFIAAADLVVVEYGHYFRALEVLPMLAGRRPRILFDYHGVTSSNLWGQHNREAVLEGLGRAGLAWCADRVIAHSCFAANELQQGAGYPRSRIDVIAHHASNRGSTQSQPHDTLRQSLKSRDARIILFVGRLAPNKRVPILVEAIARLKTTRPEAHLVVIGNNQDAYKIEAEACLERARDFGVGDRVHVLGQVDDEQVLAWYDSAHLFVMPSRHEGFCIPVLEAMAAGVPVIAAHAAALPETIGAAGLLFTPDNVAELAERMESVLASALAPMPESDGKPAIRQSETSDNTLQPAGATCKSSRRRIAVVSFRYGDNIVGGAETSLRRMALSLADAGHHVEVFSTCTTTEHAWKNDLEAGTTREDGIAVHRFPVEAFDRERHDKVVRRVLENNGKVDPATEEEFLRQGVRSESLIAELTRRRDEFDAFMTGPYLASLTCDVARAFPSKTLLAGCFHDEPTARLAVWQPVYRRVTGLIYHSDSERTFAERDLGLNHPRSHVVGTWIENTAPGDPERGRKLAGAGTYVVYIGRYSPQKNLPLLLEWAERFERSHRGKLRFVFMGQGPLHLPSHPWCVDLGHVDECDKRDLLAGAKAIVHLSKYESLSLAVLEALSQGTPAIVHENCLVLRELVRESGAGEAVADYDTFEAALVKLIDNDEKRNRLGMAGRSFVQNRYGSRIVFTDRLLEAITSLEKPLRTVMIERGRSRAAAHGLDAWRQAFGELVEKVLDQPQMAPREAWLVTPHRTRIVARLGQRVAFVPVRLANKGSHAASPDGPARRMLHAWTKHPGATRVVNAELYTPLPRVMIPGEECPAVIRIGVPDTPGQYAVEIRCVRVGDEDARGPADAVLSLAVVSGREVEAGCCPALVEDAQAALAQADRTQVLPDDYADVTEGHFASWKRNIKQKLLGNFKRAYVDVLSRRQTAFNKAILEAVQQALECCTVLDHAVTTLSAQTTAPATSGAVKSADAGLTELMAILQSLVEESTQTRARLDQLEERLSVLSGTGLESSLHLENAGQQVGTQHQGRPGN